MNSWCSDCVCGFEEFFIYFTGLSILIFFLVNANIIKNKLIKKFGNNPQKMSIDIIGWIFCWILGLILSLILGAFFLFLSSVIGNKISDLLGYSNGLNWCNLIDESSCKKMNLSQVVFDSVYIILNFVLYFVLLFLSKMKSQKKKILFVAGIGLIIVLSLILTLLAVNFTEIIC